MIDDFFLHNVLDKPVCCFSDPYTDSSDVEDGGTQLEYAADQCTDQLLSEMSPDPLTIPDLQAYICWYCARPFIGRGSFYIHLLQEAMALPGKPSKCCTPLFYSSERRDPTNIFARNSVCYIVWL